MRQWSRGSTFGSRPKPLSRPIAGVTANLPQGTNQRFAASVPKDSELGDNRCPAATWPRNTPTTLPPPLLLYQNSEHMACCKSWPTRRYIPRVPRWPTSVRVPSMLPDDRHNCQSCVRGPRKSLTRLCQLSVQSQGEVRPRAPRVAPPRYRGRAGFREARAPARWRSRRSPARTGPNKRGSTTCPSLCLPPARIYTCTRACRSWALCTRDPRSAEPRRAISICGAGCTAGTASHGSGNRTRNAWNRAGHCWLAARVHARGHPTASAPASRQPSAS